VITLDSMRIQRQYIAVLHRLEPSPAIVDMTKACGDLLVAKTLSLGVVRGWW
jgi:hypothetical protein